MNSVEAFTLLSKVINGNGDEKSIEYVNDHYYAITFKILNDLEILEIIKKHKLLNYVLKNEKCANMYHLSKEEIDLLREIEK